MRRRTAAYSLIELMVAVGVLVAAAAAAGIIALATVAQEETNARIARCTNLNEQAVRLYQLGLEPGDVNALLPRDPAAVNDNQVAFTLDTLPIPDLGTVETASSTLEYTTTTLTSDNARRTSTIKALRPSIR